MEHDIRSTAHYQVVNKLIYNTPNRQWRPCQMKVGTKRSLHMNALWTFLSFRNLQHLRVSICLTRKKQDTKRFSMVEKGTFIYDETLEGLKTLQAPHHIAQPVKNSTFWTFINLYEREWNESSLSLHLYSNCHSISTSLKLSLI